VNFHFALQHGKAGFQDKKISLANFYFRSTLFERAEFAPFARRATNGLESPQDR
jgi:hypothetical protein